MTLSPRPTLAARGVLATADLARVARRRGGARRRPRHRPPAARDGEGHVLPHARGRDRHGQRVPDAAALRALARAAEHVAAARGARAGSSGATASPTCARCGSRGSRRRSGCRRGTTTGDRSAWVVRVNVVARSSFAYVSLMVERSTSQAAKREPIRQEAADDDEGEFRRRRASGCRRPTGYAEDGL